MRLSGGQINPPSSWRGLVCWRPPISPMLNMLAPETQRGPPNELIGRPKSPKLKRAKRCPATTTNKKTNRVPIEAPLQSSSSPANTHTVAAARQLAAITSTAQTTRAERKRPPSGSIAHSAFKWHSKYSQSSGVRNKATSEGPG